MPASVFDGILKEAESSLAHLFSAYVKSDIYSQFREDKKKEKARKVDLNSFVEEDRQAHANP